MRQTLDELSLIKELEQKYAGVDPGWGFGGLGETVYKRTYSRIVPDENRTEEWHETVARCCRGAVEIGAGYTLDELERLFAYVHGMKGLFAGRFLWLGGANPGRVRGDTFINCVATTIQTPADFVFLFAMLLNGCGVGFSVERAHVYELPRVRSGVEIRHAGEIPDADFIVPDSREGWAELLRQVLESYFVTGRSFSYSTLLVAQYHPYGAPLKTFGGTASGPQALVDAITDISAVLSARAGKKLRSVDALDVGNIINRAVNAGSARRGAEIAIGDPDDFLFLRAKNWASGRVPPWRDKSNNTIVVDAYDHIPDEFWKGYDGSGEPYGLANLRLMRKYGRLKDKPRRDAGIICVNPCVTGDTLVAVADGRGAVAISDLAREGRDVPVYAWSGSAVEVRLMRNPRLTGEKKPVWRVTVDSGDSVTVTGDHRFILRNGERKSANELVPGDSLRLLTRYKATFNEMFGSDAESKSSQDYWWINGGQATNKAEHKHVAEFSIGRRIRPGEIVHHRDRNGSNNAPANLEVMLKEAHDRLHADEMRGDRNPMRRALAGEFGTEHLERWLSRLSAGSQGLRNGHASAITNEQMRDHARTLTTQLGRQATPAEWAEYSRENGLPVMSKWRQANLGSTKNFLRWAALDCQVEAIDPSVDPRVARRYFSLLEQGYRVEIVDGRVFVLKRCGVCDREIRTMNPEQQYCSGSSCVATAVARKSGVIGRRAASLARTNAQRQDQVREQQVKIFVSLRADLLRDPSKQEWRDACVELGVSREIGRVSSPFRSYEALVDAAADYNHAVVLVEFVGYENVYNGTVDDFHNYYIGGWESTTRSGKSKQQFVATLNCGEVPLANHELCILSELVLPRLESKDEATDVARLLYKTQKAITGLTYADPTTNTVVHRNRRLGLSVMGIAQEGTRAVTWLSDVYDDLRAFDAEWSKHLGVPESIKLTCVQPGGTKPLMPGVTPGASSGKSEYYVRRVRFMENDPLALSLRARGYPTCFDVNADGSEERSRLVVEFPCVTPPGSVLEPTESAVDQLERVKLLQTEWADNAVSITVGYTLEELPMIKRWLSENYETSVKSVSFLLKTGHGFKLAPIEPIGAAEYRNRLRGIKSESLAGVQAGELIGDSCESGACPVR